MQSNTVNYPVTLSWNVKNVHKCVRVWLKILIFIIFYSLATIIFHESYPVIRPIHIRAINAVACSLIFYSLILLVSLYRQRFSACSFDKSDSPPPLLIVILHFFIDPVAANDKKKIRRKIKRWHRRWLFECVFVYFLKYLRWWRKTRKWWKRSSDLWHLTSLMLRN